MPARFLNALAALALAVAASPAATAEVRLQAGQTDAAHAVLAFAPGPQPGRLTIATHRAGVAGSRLTIAIDRSPTAAFSHILTTADCRFPGGGPSVCEVSLVEGDPALAVIVESFRLGREAHVRVQDAGVMRMDHSVSLIGFAAALDD